MACDGYVCVRAMGVRWVWAGWWGCGGRGLHTRRARRDVCRRRAGGGSASAKAISASALRPPGRLIHEMDSAAINYAAVSMARFPPSPYAAAFLGNGWEFRKQKDVAMTADNSKQNNFRVQTIGDGRSRGRGDTDAAGDKVSDDASIEMNSGDEFRA
ncbi:hypothetical protein C8F04DRAFT_1173407 [Mycena alexandri]|uniref:Uncharacterized protein n=1 Tax=Mycena alexandri TaxID=1745969 RepID=A0AAD6TIU2_9AGAR|nr:hypothetical protein C8F04DRAFT_1173407 [Mycena alexandri]